MDQIMYQPAICLPGQSRRIVSIGTIDLLIPWQATNGQMSVWQSVVAPGEGPPMHIHRMEDEVFHVISGTFRFWCGDETFEGGPGTTAVLPRGIPHTFQNVGTTEGRFLGMATPGGFEEFFLELERGKITEPAAVMAVGEKYGLSFIPPKAANAA
jgi:mannose-6-phosphate isomerase-like protein (cupin superfamily)